MIKAMTIATRSRNELMDITSQIQNVVRDSGISEGLCTIFVPHTTAGLTINEGADPSVQRDILAQFGFHPPREPSQFRVAVVQGGHHQINDLGPHPLLSHGNQTVQDRLEFAVDDFPVVFLGKGLQIHLDGVNFPAEFFQRVLVDVTTSDDDALDTGGVARLGRIHHVFVKDDGLAVSVGDRGAAVLLRQGGQPARRKVDAPDLFGPHL